LVTKLDVTARAEIASRSRAEVEPDRAGHGKSLRYVGVKFGRRARDCNPQNRWIFSATQHRMFRTIVLCRDLWNHGSSGFPTERLRGKSCLRM